MKKYRIVIKGELDSNWKGWFEELDFHYEKENTVLSGNIKDETALHGILNRMIMEGGF